MKRFAEMIFAGKSHSVIHTPECRQCHTLLNTFEPLENHRELFACSSSVWVTERNRYESSAEGRIPIA